MNCDLRGKNALVLGASKGIGKAVAFELARLGATITMAARSSDILSQLIGELDNNSGQQHDFIKVDVTDSNDLTKKVRSLTMVKPIHILINNSGGPPGGPIIDAAPEDFLSAYKAHLIAGQILVKLTSPGMKASGYGRIINIVSTSVREPIPGLGVSNTTRGAVASWAKTMSLELGPFGITVNNILPGFTRTGRLESIVAKWAKEKNLTVEEMEKEMFKQVPAGRFAEPEEVGEVAAFLATPAAAYVNGVSLPVDGGRLKSI